MILKLGVRYYNLLSTALYMIRSVDLAELFQL